MKLWSSIILALLLSLNLKFCTGSGANCIGCTMAVGMLLEFVEFNNITVEQGLEALCSYLPAEYGYTCKRLVDIFEAPLIIILEKTSHPDLVCRSLAIRSLPDLGCAVETQD